ncbi:unnamed protein product [Prunus armeniaca]
MKKCPIMSLSHFQFKGRGGVNLRVLHWRMMCLKKLLSGRKRPVALKQVTGRPYLKMKLVVSVKKRLIALWNSTGCPYMEMKQVLSVSKRLKTLKQVTSLVSENNDSDSCMDEFDAIPMLPYQCPNLLVIVNQLPPRTTHGKLKSYASYLCQETTDRPLELNRLPIYGDEASVLGVETTEHTEAHPTIIDGCISALDLHLRFGLGCLCQSFFDPA